MITNLLKTVKLLKYGGVKSNQIRKRKTTDKIKLCFLTGMPRQSKKNFFEYFSNADPV